MEQWRQGEWKLLSGISQPTVEQHPRRAQLALLVASSHHQLGDREATLLWARLAISWGAEETDLARILISGVHNTLGRCSALAADHERMASHFQQAVMRNNEPPSLFTSQDRTIRELANLNLLQEATAIVERQITALQNLSPDSSREGALIAILKSEVGLLNHELAMALKRGQLRGHTSDEPAPDGDIAESEAIWLKNLSNRASSQIGQELWVLEKTSYKRGGFFVEFGATDGILLSNTHMLEKEFGWNGICAEPNPTSFRELEKNRGCIVSPACIGPITGERVEFIFAEAYGGMARDADSDNHKDKRQAYADNGNTAILTTISLHDFLVEHRAPRIIDYLSIDTEGSEFSILETFPFERWDIRYLTIEHNFTAQREKIRKLLESRGYRCQEAQWDDWYFKPEHS
ncbi:hypothetical protein GCM10023212_23390 [Luteolibacter yonseiensis]